MVIYIASNKLCIVYNNYMCVVKCYNYFELEMSVQSDNAEFPIVYFDLVIYFKATCSNISQIKQILFLVYVAFNSL